MSRPKYAAAAIYWFLRVLDAEKRKSTPQEIAEEMGRICNFPASRIWQDLHIVAEIDQGLIGRTVKYERER